MATHVLTDATVVVNSVDLSTNVQSVSVEVSMETQDSTAMGHTARTNLPSLEADAVSVTFLQDFAAADVDATIWPLFKNKTSHTVVIKPSSSAVGTTNPTFTLTGYVSEYSPIGGSVGDMHTSDVSWVNGSSTGIARATS